MRHDSTEPAEAGPRLMGAEWRALFDDIGRVALALGRELYGDGVVVPAAEGGAFGASGREQLAFLACHMAAIETTVGRISREPRAALARDDALVPPGRARRPDAASVLAAVRRGELEPADAEGALAEQLGGRLPTRVADRALRASDDTPEGRWLAGVLAEWRRDLRAIAACAHLCGEPETADAARRIEGRLARLADGPPPAARAVLTQTVLRDSRYRALHALHARYQRALRFAWGDGQDAGPALAAREPWQLYEIWCFFRVAATLRALGWRARGGDAVRLARGRLTVELAKGRASRVAFARAGEQLSLYYNRAFPSAAAGSRHASSRTHAQIPDIALERRGRFLLLDAKFRDYRADDRRHGPARPPALIDDVDKMHAYRDAIVVGGQPVVDAAWCLYPGNGQSREERRSIIAYPSSTARHPFGTAGVGALRLRPAADDAPLLRLLAEWAGR